MLDEAQEYLFSYKDTIMVFLYIYLIDRIHPDENHILHGIVLLNLQKKLMFSRLLREITIIVTQYYTL